MPRSSTAEKRTERIAVRLRPKEAGLIRQAARAGGRSISELVRGASIRAARRELLDDESETLEETR